MVPWLWQKGSWSDAGQVVTTLEELSLIAAFPWYDLPSVQWANDVIWHATGLGGQLDRTIPCHEQWRASHLLVSQACGLDLWLQDAPIEPILAPSFELDCAPGTYYSLLVGDPAGQVAAVNSFTSRSGCTALLSNCEPAELLVTGSHLGSLEALREGPATVASIDAVTWQLLQRHAPEHLEGIAVWGRSSTAPAPPYVISRGRPAGPIREALTSALDKPSTLEARRALGLCAVKPVTKADYHAHLAEYQATEHRIPTIRQTIRQTIRRATPQTNLASQLETSAQP